MSDTTPEPVSFQPYVGYVLLPRTPADLDPTKCPACFSALGAPVCHACGLDLGHPSAQQLRDAMARLSSDLDQRLELIGRIRFETAQRNAALASQQPATPSATAVATPTPAPVAPLTPVASTATVAPPTVAPVASPTQQEVQAPTAAPRRTFGVQGVLLTVGAILLSIAAIFFLVFAFVIFDTLGRSITILAVTIAAIVGAIVLKRRTLPAAAEAVGSVAIVLVYLDAWALRATNSAVATIAEAAYWGTVLVLTAIGFLIWHARSHIRVTSIVGFTAIGPGVGLLALESARAESPAASVFAFSLGVAVGALAHVAAGRFGAQHSGTFERVMSLTLAALGLVVAGIAAWMLDTPLEWIPAVALLGVALVALLHVLVIAKRSDALAFGGVISSLGAIAAASTAWSVALRLESHEYLTIVPPLVATAIALGLEFLARTRSAGATRPRHFAIVGAWSAAAVAFAAAVPALGVSTTRVAEVVGLVGRGAWSVPGTHLLPQHVTHVASLVTLVTALALVGVVWALGRVLLARRAILGWGVAAVLILAAAVPGMLWVAIAGWIAIAIAAVIVLGLPRVTARWVRAATATTAAVATVLAYVASWASEHTWLVGTLAAIVVLLGYRFARAGSIANAALLGGAVAVAFAGVGALGAWVTDDVAAPAQFCMALAVLITALSAFSLARWITELDRRVSFWLVIPVGAVASVFVWFGSQVPAIETFLPQPITGILLAVAAVAALAIWMLRDADRGLDAERFLASALAAPALAWVADAVLRAAAAPELAIRLAPAIGALIAVIASIAIAIARSNDDARLSRDGAAGVVAGAAIVLTLSTDALWVVLLIVAVAALLVAVSPDGLFASSSPRRHVGWLALALAIAGLWVRLADSNVTDLEPFVLPLAAALLAVAALIARARRSHAAPWIAFGGLLVALLPLGAAGATGEPLRAFIVAAVAGVLLLVGSLIIGTATSQRWLDVLALAGAIGVIVAAIGRALTLVVRGQDATAEPEAWLGGAVILLVIAAFGQVRSRDDRAVRIRHIAAQALGIVALSSIFVVEAIAVDSSPLGSLRALTVVLLFSVVHVIAMLVLHAPLTAAVGWVSLALGAAAGVIGFATRALDPLELGSMPVALALLATGAVRLARDTTARSWPQLAPGLLVLFVPSLVATLTEAPLWRLVALGVVAVACIVFGATARLQAPLIIGAVVAVLHGIRTFAPQIVAVYELTPWWLWAAVGGAILLFLGVTFEKRRRDARAFVAAIGRLR